MGVCYSTIDAARPVSLFNDTTQLCVGVLNKCGIADARLEMNYGTTGDDATRAAMITRARDLGGAFDRC